MFFFFHFFIYYIFYKRTAVIMYMCKSLKSVLIVQVYCTMRPLKTNDDVQGSGTNLNFSFHLEFILPHKIHQRWRVLQITRHYRIPLDSCSLDVQFKIRIYIIAVFYIIFSNLYSFKAKNIKKIFIWYSRRFTPSILYSLKFYLSCLTLRHLDSFLNTSEFSFFISTNLNIFILL